MKLLVGNSAARSAGESRLDDRRWRRPASVSGKVTFQITSSAKGRFLVIWFTKLPPKTGTGPLVHGPGVQRRGARHPITAVIGQRGHRVPRELSYVASQPTRSWVLVSACCVLSLVSRCVGGRQGAPWVVRVRLRSGDATESQEPGGTGSGTSLPAQRVAPDVARGGTGQLTVGRCAGVGRRAAQAACGR